MLAKIAKALAAGLLGAYAVYQIGRGAESPAGVGLSFDEWVNVISTAITVGFGTWFVPNAAASESK